MIASQRQCDRSEVANEVPSTNRPNQVPIFIAHATMAANVHACPVLETPVKEHSSRRASQQAAVCGHYTHTTTRSYDPDDVELHKKSARKVVACNIVSPPPPPRGAKLLFSCFVTVEIVAIFFRSRSPLFSNGIFAPSIIHTIVHGSRTQGVVDAVRVACVRSREVTRSFVRAEVVKSDCPL